MNEKQTVDIYVEAYYDPDREVGSWGCSVLENGKVTHTESSTDKYTTFNILVIEGIVCGLQHTQFEILPNIHVPKGFQRPSPLDTSKLPRETMAWRCLWLEYQLRSMEYGTWDSQHSRGIRASLAALSHAALNAERESNYNLDSSCAIRDPDSSNKIHVKGFCIEGVGGWAAKVVTATSSTMITGTEQNTTEAAMEIKAAIEGLGIAPSESLIVHNTYIAHIMHEIDKDQQNAELWNDLKKIIGTLGVNIEWREAFGAHSGHVELHARRALTDAFA